jgi:PEP-CTERM motif
MKKLVLTAVASLACLAAFAQGKIGFNNDSLHLVYWASGAGSLNGSAVNSDNMVAGLGGTGALAADLYMGTSSSSLTLISSTTFGALAAGPGKWTSMSVTAPAPFATGVSVFIDVAVHSTEKPLGNTLDLGTLSTFAAYGSSGVFTFTMGGPITYPPMWSQTAGTWAPGTFPLPQYGAGSMGAIGITVVPVPEPTSFALAGLGAAALLIFRRRK